MKRRRIWLGVLALVGCVPTITVLPDDVPDASTEDVAANDLGADVGTARDVVDVVSPSDVASDAVMDAGLDAAEVSTADTPDAALPDASDATSVMDASDAGDVVSVDAADASPSQRSCPDGAERGCGVVRVEGGTFTLGSNDAGYPASPEIQNVTVSSFTMDAHEVTVARFRRFWSAGHPSPSSPVVYPGGAVPFEGTITEPDATPSNTQCNWSSSAGSREAHPINCVGWATAMAFCVWDGGRLPTEAEWEFAARGRRLAGVPYPRAYPWGDERPMATPRGACDRAQVGECSGEDGAATRRVGSFAATEGLYDLIGNVQEWVADSPAEYNDPRCWGEIGGSFMNPLCIVPSTRTGAGLRSTSFMQNAGTGATIRESVTVLADQLTAAGLRCIR